MFFTTNEHDIIVIWNGVWAILCAVSTLFTVLTFCVDVHRFKYPEKPIIFLSFCYFVISLAFIVGFVTSRNRSIVCVPLSSPAASIATTTSIPPQIIPPQYLNNLDGSSRISSSSFVNQQQQQHQEKFLLSSYNVVQKVITQGAKHSSCTILAMIYYYFTISSSIWWVNLTVTWFLAAGLKWGNEAIERNAYFFHLAAWGVPALLMIAVLVTRSIDGDIYSGICSVGNWDADVLKLFVLLPLVVCLALGSLFLVAGFVAMLKIRQFMKHDGTKIEKLERLMIKISVFSVLYTVPAVIIVACYFYQVFYFDFWMAKWWYPRVCGTGGSSSTDDAVVTISKKFQCEKLKREIEQAPRAEFVVFMIKYLAILVVGITSGFWMWSSKTLNSWNKFYATVNRNCCRCCGDDKQKQTSCSYLPSSIPTTALLHQHHQQQIQMPPPPNSATGVDCPPPFHRPYVDR